MAPGRAARRACLVLVVLSADGCARRPAPSAPADASIESAQAKLLREVVDEVSGDGAVASDAAIRIRDRLVELGDPPSDGVVLQAEDELGPGARREKDRAWGDIWSLPQTRDNFLGMIRELLRGDIEPLIFGEDVGADMFPDCVAILVDRRLIGTGTLVAPAVVVTAAHIAENGTRVTICLADSIRSDDASRRPTGILRHYDGPPAMRTPEWRPDLAVVRLDQPVDVPPRAIAGGDAIDRSPHVRVAGYGRTDLHGLTGEGTRRAVDVSIASCKCETAPDVHGCVTGFELVAISPLGETDACRNDSGGPAYVRSERGEWLLGCSTLRPTANSRRVCGDGGIYLRLHEFEDWILAQAAN